MARFAIRLFALITVFVSSFAFSSTVINYKKLANYDWSEVNTANFQIISNEKPKKLHALAIELEEFRYFVSKYMGLAQLEGLPPVRLLALKDNRSFQYFHLSSEIAGLYSSQYGGFFSIAAADKLRLGKRKPTWGRHVVLHEMLHHFEDNQAQKLFNPLWYSEGIAEYLATMIHRKDKIIFGELDVLSFRFSWMMNNSGARYESVDIENLFKAKHSIPPKLKGTRARNRAANQFYARSFITTHYLSSQPEKRKQLNHYLRLLNNNHTVDEAFEKAFKTTYADLTQQIDDYLAGRKVLARVFTTNGNGFKFPEFKTDIKPLKIKDALYKATDIRLRFSGDVDGKKFNVKDTIDAFSGFYRGSDYSALLRARFDKDAKPEKIKALMQPLLDKGAHLSEAFYLYGDALTSQAHFARTTGDDAWRAFNKQSRSYYRKSVSVNHYNGDALSALADSYLYTPYNDKNLKEGVVCYEIMSVLKETKFDLKKHALYRIALGEYDEALTLLNRYIGTTDNGWSKGFGTWMRDALIMTTIPNLKVIAQKDDTISYSDGSHYVGDIKNNMPHGVGKYKSENNIHYSGNWLNGLPHGMGFLVASNGSNYKGNFESGVVNGMGRLNYDKGENPNHYYIGEFYRFMEHGNGKMHYPLYIHDGPWVKGLEHGLSIVTLKKTEKQKTINWIWGVPEIIMPDGMHFISRKINYATFMPKNPSSGLCKNKDKNTFYECDISL